MRVLLVVPLLAACGFSVSGSNVGIDAGRDMDVDAILPDTDPGRWWDDTYTRRVRLQVHTGSRRPDKGYLGYTVRLVAPISTFTGAQPDFSDLRVVLDDSSSFTELPRHIIASSTEVDLRFKMPQDLADNDTWSGAYLYYANPGVSTKPPSDDGTQVYLWFDDASADRRGMYSGGRMDPWQATGHAATLGFMTDAYAYNTGDNSQESYRRNVDERDVYVEAQWFHTGCYPTNMQSGVCARGVIATGTGATEDSTHYYCSSRGQNPTCANGDQAIYDGDVVDADNETIALQGVDDPTPIVEDQWRAQGLGVFGAAPTQLRFWDADAAWASMAFPPGGAIQASGPTIGATHEHTMRGFAGIMLSQDIARVRNIVIRRYTEPEPTVMLGTEETR